MEKTLSFQWGQEKQIKISKAGRKSSLFYESYRQAMAGVLEIMHESRLYIENEKQHLECKSTGAAVATYSDYLLTADRNFYNYPNNIIVFSGKRGVGKSSALLTFVNSLASHESELFSKEFFEDLVSRELTQISVEKAEKSLSNATFLPLTPIDPTKLETGNHILAVVLAKMFRLAAETWENEASRRNPQDRLDRKNDLLRSFEQCYKHILAIKNIDQTNDFQVLDALEELGDSVELKREFALLVKKLLAFCKPECQESFLVLQIDDTDMNMNFSYELLEDIRKYLIIPRVIIVMAADMDHLTSIIAEEFARKNSRSIEDGNAYERNLATQYLVKFFPQTRQIWLPSLNSYLKEHSKDIKICCTVMGEPVLPDESEFQDIQKQVFRLIYEKTGLIYLKREDHFHYVIPDNMRAMSHFLAMLSQMKEVAKPDEDKFNLILDKTEQLEAGKLKEHITTLNTRLENVQRFRQYFMHTWLTNNLSPEHIRFMNALHQMSIGNKINYIYNIVKSLRQKQKEGQYTQKATYANLIFELNLYEKTAVNEQSLKFGFAVRNYFSLLAHCLVLEDLILWYEEESHKEKKDGEVPIDSFNFTSLYPIFGSHLFPPTTGQDDKAYSVYTIKNPVPGQENLEFYAHWHPKLPEIREAENLSSIEKKALGTLCTLFLDYKSPEDGLEEPSIEADITSYILNCLYISGSDSITPLLKKYYREANENVNFSCDVPSNDFRNKALLVVLNSDVQGVIAKTLAKSILPGHIVNKKPKIEFSSALNMGSIFNEITSAFQTEEQHIKCLKELDLSSWSNAVLQTHVLGLAGEYEDEFKKSSQSLEKLVKDFLNDSKD